MQEGPEYIATIANDYRGEQIIYCVEGTLNKLYPEKNTAHGTLQNGEITDDNGDMLKITFADCSLNMSARNQRVMIESTEGRHGWTGCKVKDDQTYGRAIWVTPSATVTFPNGGSHNAPPPRQQQQQQRPQGGQQRNQGRQQTQQQQRPPQGNQGRGQPQNDRQQRPAQGGGGLNKPENQFQILERITDCYAKTFTLVNERMRPVFDELKVPAEQVPDLIQRSVATVFVDVGKSGVLATWNPNFKVSKYPPPPTDPTQWKEAVIPAGSLEGRTLESLNDEELKKLFEYYDQKQSNSALAECVYKAAEDRQLFKQQEQAPAGQEAPEDDIPF